MKLRVFRPFPVQQVRDALGKIKLIGVMDRCISFGLEGGPVFHEIRSHLYGGDAPVLPFVYGLGGRDTNDDQILDVFRTLQKSLNDGVKEREVEFVGLRE